MDAMTGILSDEWVALKGDVHFVTIMTMGSKLLSMPSAPDSPEHFVSQSLKKGHVQTLIGEPQDQFAFTIVSAVASW
jgi:hypothetical protein